MRKLVGRILYRKTVSGLLYFTFALFSFFSLNYIHLLCMNLTIVMNFINVNVSKLVRDRSSLIPCTILKLCITKFSDISVTI